MSRRSSSGWKTRWHPDDPVRSSASVRGLPRNGSRVFFYDFGKMFVVVRRGASEHEIDKTLLRISNIILSSFILKFTAAVGFGD